MEKVKFVFILLLFFGLMLPAFAVGEFETSEEISGSAHEQGFGSEYAGTETCGRCHGEIYDVFMKSGHPWKLNKVVDG